MKIEIRDELVELLKNRVDGVFEEEGDSVSDEGMKLWLESEIEYWMSGENDEFNELFDRGFEDSVNDFFGN